MKDRPSIAQHLWAVTVILCPAKSSLPVDISMNKGRLPVLITLLLLLAVPSLHQARALGGVTLTAPTRSSVTIDGTLDPSEWADGTRLAFRWASNNASGSLNQDGDVWVKTNGTDLLLAVGGTGRANTNQGADSYNYTLSLLFDNDNNGVVNDNEDMKSLGITYSPSGSPTQTYGDLHYSSTQGFYVDDAYVNGTAAGSNSSPAVGFGNWAWEFAVPLASGLLEDFTLVQNASIGFEIVYAEFHYQSLSLVSSGWAFWEVSYSNGLPTGTNPSANGWAVIVWTNLQAPISDTTPPTIGTPVIQPTSPGSGDTVTVSVNVTDTGSGVKNVSITYTTDNWMSVNTTLLAAYNITTHIARAQVPALSFGGQVSYYIVAFDNAGDRALNNNSGNYFTYDVSAPWFISPWFLVAIALAAVAAILALAYSRRRKKSATQFPSATS